MMKKSLPIKTPWLLFGSTDDDGYIEVEEMHAVELEKMTGSFVSVLFDGLAEATFFYDPNGKIVSEDNYSNVLRAFRTDKLRAAMERDLADYGIDWKEEYVLSADYDKVVLFWN